MFNVNMLFLRIRAPTLPWLEFTEKFELYLEGRRKFLTYVSINIFAYIWRPLVSSCYSLPF